MVSESRRFWRSLRIAGLEYVAREHWDNAVPAASTPTTEPISEIVEPVTPQEPTEAPNEGLFPEEWNDSMSSRRAKKLSRKEKEEQLAILRAEVSTCTLCSELCSTRTQTVFNDGTPHAELCFVGEAPGADEDAQGVPFVGKAGQLLTKIIEACKLKREEVYICNVLKCRPPDNRNPEPSEVENCRPYLERQLDLLQPKMIVALGKFAASYLLGRRPEDTPITKLRGQIMEYRGIPVMITLHPAYLLRNPPAKADVWADMKTVMRKLGRPIE